MTTDDPGTGAAAAADPAPVWLGAGEIDAALGTIDAQDALAAALREHVDPEAESVRTVLDIPGGSMFLMPSTGPRMNGVKVLTATSGNPVRGLPLIRGQYLLFDAATGRPVAAFDGIALTNLRTAAVTTLAVRHMVSQPSAPRIVIIGSGTQARAHAAALSTTFPTAPVGIIARNRTKADELAASLGPRVTAVDRDQIGHADVVVCCTSSNRPVLHDAEVPDSAVIAAVGAYTLTSWEVDPNLVARSTVVVESRASASAEAGDVMHPVDLGLLDPASFHTLSDLVRGRVEWDDGRPRLFKSTGMSWQDLVVAAAAYDAIS